MRASARFRGFLAALALSTVCILWRSAFRLAELREGWRGPVLARQGLFIGFEGVLVLVAVVALNVFHPVLCAPELFRPGAAFACCGRRRRAAADEDKASSVVDVPSVSKTHAVQEHGKELPSVSAPARPSL
ncbi:hypothetical protein CDD83_9559 [Cordyceps sp. RAO-2017]|nr:hypothetical protein CDD83_9559 [Cordyceps sp. RAO-2017]